MPYSEIAYHDIGLSNFREERETPEDRVEYEDHRLETVRLHAGLEACSEKPFKTKVQGDSEAPSSSAEPISRPTLQQFYTNMEGIQKYFGVGGGTTQKSFKQDTKAVYKKMLRDHRYISSQDLAGGSFWACWDLERKGRRERFMWRSWKGGISKIQTTQNWKLYKTQREDVNSGETSGATTRHT